MAEVLTIANFYHLLPLKTHILIYHLHPQVSKPGLVLNDSGDAAAAIRGIAVHAETGFGAGGV